MRCLDIQLGIRLLWCPRYVSFWMTRRTAAWSLGRSAFPGSQRHGSSSGSHAPQPWVDWSKYDQSLKECVQFQWQNNPSSAVGLSDLKDVRKERLEHGSYSRVAIGECLVPDIKSSFFWITDVEVTQNNAHPIGICRPVWVNKTQSAT